MSTVKGGRLAAPIFKQFIKETRGRWDSRPFVAPLDIHMVKINRVSGKRVFEGAVTKDPKSAVIWEAFKADAEAKRSNGLEDLAEQREALLAALRRGAARVPARSANPVAAIVPSEPDALPTAAGEEIVGPQ